jgi:3-hydroxybutyryl-CoA dehydrogenase
MSRAIGSVLIYGYGVMGRGVAQTFASSGFKTMVKSSRAAALTDLPKGVEPLAALPRDPPDLIIEFVPEDVATKQRVYAEIEAAYPTADTIIATGTSGLDLVELAEQLARPQRFVGLHYFMPADKTAIVEVMAGPQASRELVDHVAAAIERAGKEAVRLYETTIGFLINRLQHAILHESY